ncbi:hypothetical protein [Stutzerimonas tarimensis]|uniref:Curlin associated repeat-containing protein n=1 Tax=Stutzerimonas tarimensis TaxID=1507735 RepID=A0ABV7T8H7_9GAMM
MFSLRLSVASILLATGSLALANDGSLVLNQTGENNEAVVQRLEGIGNHSSQAQVGNDNRSVLTQAGDDNVAETFQNGGDLAELEQTGNGNLANIYQASTEQGHTASVVQSGNLNEVRLVQSDGFASSARLYQTGDSNFHSISQTYINNHLEATSIGDRNQIMAVQNGTGDATLRQTGNDNVIAVNQQVFPYGGTIAVTQQGDFNRASVAQTGGGRYAAGEVTLRQLGDGNQAYVNQAAGFNEVDWTQEGERNVLVAYQGTRGASIVGGSVGDNNRADISQVFDDMQLDLNQNGSLNYAQVTQEAYGAEASISQFGVANQVHLHQSMGADAFVMHSAAIRQNGSGNSAQVTQR